MLFRPAILVKYVGNSPCELDLVQVFLWPIEFCWVALSSEKALSFMTEFNISESLKLGYAYDIWFNELQTRNKGSHEIRLEFALDIYRTRMLTPRFF
ncbi:MAG: type IX secretion system membrane protein PorP/SprF [Chitinophagaceae bacterium]|nr:type IX secretion system membrane protein PorP/SprF [Chitinophagaceae bacterium]